MGNVNSVTGALDTDAAARALMTHRNTPAQDTGVSPAVLLFGRNLRDHLLRNDRSLRPEWSVIADSREQALAKRALKEIETEKKELKPLCVGDSVQIQNQSGNHPNKWFSTGVIAEVLPNRQYQVVVDGSRRISLRNRRFLKKILPISRNEIDLTPILPTRTTPHDQHSPNSFTYPQAITESVNRGTGDEPSPGGSTEILSSQREIDSLIEGLNPGLDSGEASSPTSSGMRSCDYPTQTFLSKNGRKVP